MMNARGRPSTERRLATLVAAVLSLVAPAVAGAADPATADSGIMTFPNVRVVNAPVAPAATDAQGAAGLRAFIDPVTGQLRSPTQEEVEALMAVEPRIRSGRVTRPLQFVSGPNGSAGAILDESYMSYSVARRAADDWIAQACIAGEAEALAWLRSELPAMTLTLGKSAARGERQ